jgi:hypothetical protein
MSTPRGTFAALVSKNCNFIYVIGGFNGKPLDLVERYDVMKDQWEYLSSMNQSRFMHAACLAHL